MSKSLEVTFTIFFARAFIREGIFIEIYMVICYILYVHLIFQFSLTCVKFLTLLSDNICH